MSNLRRVTATLTALLFGLVATASGAQAYVAQNTPEAEGESGRLVLVLDSSGSMEEPDASGQSKIEAARTALSEVIGGLPEEGNVGLRVFGGTVFSRDDPGACKDSQLVVPVKDVDKDALGTAVDEYEPYGETPIAYSLQQAADDLGGEGQRSILLVSDGEETCDVDPCVVAEKIAAEGIDLRIDVVGLNVDKAARDQLSCIAERGNGTYYDVGDADEFADSLEEVSARALQEFEVTGTPIEGTPEYDGSPTMETGSQYTDTVPAVDVRKYYTIRRGSPGSNIIVGVSGQSKDTENPGQLEVRILTADGEECGVAFPTALGDGAYSLMAGSASTLTDSTLEPDDPCATADELQVYITQTGTDDVVDTPIQLKLWEYGAVEDYDSLPGEQDSSDVPWVEMTPDPGNATEVAGGASLEAAPELTAGTSYTDTVVPGEMRIFKVSAEWGQRLQAQVDVPPAEGDAFDPAAYLGVQIFGPAGATATTPSSEATTQSSLGVGQGTQVSAMAVEVRYRNHESPHDYSTAAAIEGDYYVGVALSEDPEGDTYEVPFTLTTSLEGEAGAGEPAFAEVRLPVAGSQDDEPDDASQGDQEQDDASEDGEEQDGGSPDTESTASPSEDATEPVAGESDDSGGLSPTTLVVGLGGLALLLGGGYGIYRFTRS